MSLKIAAKIVPTRRFWPLFVALQTGTFNDNLLKQSLVVMMTYGGLSFLGIQQNILIPLATTLFTMPFLLLSCIAGQVADKYDRGDVLRRIKQAEIIIMIIAATGFLLGNAPLLLFALMCMGAQSAFFAPTKNALLPQWLEKKELITGNALMSGFVYVFILMGQAVATLLVLKTFGPKVIAIALLSLALIGYLAARKAPAAPAPAKDLKINWNILTESVRMVAYAWKDQAVFRPLAGIAWFYGFAAIMLVVLPTYMENVLGYDETVLLVCMVLTTIGMMSGALLCVVLTRGKDATWLSALGIVGVAIFAFDIYLSNHTLASSTLGTLADFKADPRARRFTIDLIGAALCGGFFVVPLQAMSQHRADPMHRARLLAAGSIMYNLAVNVCQGMIAGFAALQLPDRMAFLFIAIMSALVALYAIWRTFNPIKELSETQA